MKRDVPAEEMLRVLEDFKKEMWRELLENRPRKGNRDGWLSMHPMKLVGEIFHHTAKLHAAVRQLQELRSRETTLDTSEEVRKLVQDVHHYKHLVRELAADVGNMAMMVADSAGVLSIEGMTRDTDRLLSTPWESRARP